MGDYEVVYDAGNFDPAEWAPLGVGAILMVVGLFLIAARGKPKITLVSNWPPSPAFAFFFGFATLFTVLTTAGAVKSWLEVRRALNDADYHVISGPVTQFTPMPVEGHADESFTLNGVTFSYSDYELSPGFNNTRSHGGPVDGDSDLRVAYVCRPSKDDCSDPLIVRLEKR